MMPHCTATASTAVGANASSGEWRNVIQHSTPQYNHHPQKHSSRRERHTPPLPRRTGGARNCTDTTTPAPTATECQSRLAPHAAITHNRLRDPCSPYLKMVGTYFRVSHSATLSLTLPHPSPTPAPCCRPVQVPAQWRGHGRDGGDRRLPDGKPTAGAAGWLPRRQGRPARRLGGPSRAQGAHKYYYLLHIRMLS